GSFEDCLFGKDRGDLVPVREIVFIGPIVDTAGGSLVGRTRPRPAIVHGELFEISQDRERQLGGPGVASKLVGWMGIILEVDRWLFRLQKKLTRKADLEAVVGGFCRAPNLDRVLVNDVFVSLRIACLVCHLPAQCFEERINERLPEVGLVISLAAIRVEVALERGNQLGDNWWDLTHQSPLST